MSSNLPIAFFSGSMCTLITLGLDKVFSQQSTPLELAVAFAVSFYVSLIISKVTDTYHDQKEANRKETLELVQRIVHLEGKIK